MRTQKQIEASRRNGALSNGPITPEGKARSAANATTHGLTSQTIVLTNDCLPPLRGTARLLHRAVPAANESEFCCVEEMAMSPWRLRCAAGYETALLDYQVESVQPSTPKNHQSIDQTTRGALAWRPARSLVRLPQPLPL